jgi:hypothetical protein
LQQFLGGNCLIFDHVLLYCWSAEKFERSKISPHIHQRGQHQIYSVTQEEEIREFEKLFEQKCQIFGADLFGAKMCLKWRSSKWITLEAAQSIKTVPRRERRRTQARNLDVLQHTCSQLTGFVASFTSAAP